MHESRLNLDRETVLAALPVLPIVLCLLLLRYALWLMKRWFTFPGYRYTRVGLLVEDGRTYASKGYSAMDQKKERRHYQT